MRPIRRALLSVYDKTGLVELAHGLADRGVELVSTGGTLTALRGAGLAATAVADLTGFPECLDGRVKTLHPRVHAGLLADLRRPEHEATLAELGIAPLGLVVVNLYPFSAARDAGAAYDEVVEMIDIGGPAMVRGGAKNHASVGVVVDPADYARVLAALAENDGCLPEALRRELAAKAFRHTADYDRAIADWLGGGAPRESFPARLELALERVLIPRYGENPHQSAAIYAEAGGAGVFGGFAQLQGKELSYNNFLDADSARKLAGQFEEPAVVIVKHGNPCGVGRGPDGPTAWQRALACDPVSAFGGVVATTVEVDEALGAALAELFLEVVVAPGFTASALVPLGAKKALRLLRCPRYRPAAGSLELRPVHGGFLAQELDVAADLPDDWQVVTRRAPSGEEPAALALAWTVSRLVKSNAIVVANAVQTVGIGAGQMSRVDSCRLAVEKAQLPLRGCAAGSDAFFPFRDGVDVLAAAGVTAIAQPGGSVRDAEVIAAADELGLAMVFTGRRHFRH